MELRIRRNLEIKIAKFAGRSMTWEKEEAYGDF